jgi:DNA-binding PadR family transcriptional regulator
MRLTSLGSNDLSNDPRNQRLPAPYGSFNHTALPMPPDPRAFLPLKPVDLQLLLALSQRDLHGYGLVQAIAEGTDGLVQLDPGNLYRVIKRLLAEGMIDEADRRAAPDLGEERRRYYRLTALGARVLAAEVRRLRALVASPAVRALAHGGAS